MMCRGVSRGSCGVALMLFVPEAVVQGVKLFRYQRFAVLKVTMFPFSTKFHSLKPKP